jgi:fused signal recognition particle receptor
VAVVEPIAKPQPVAAVEPIRPGPIAALPLGLDIVLDRGGDAVRPTPPPVALPAQPVSPIGSAVVAAIGDPLAIGPSARPGLASHGSPAAVPPVFLFAIGEDPVLVPEPGTLLLFGGGLLALGLSARRR